MDEVVVESSGALRQVVLKRSSLTHNCETAHKFHRNLCIDGGYDICAEMYNKNILEPLKTFVPKVRGRILFKMPM